jgi:hypothetical protein
MLPELKGKLDGISMRVPTPNVSCVDLAAVLQRTVTAAEVNAAFQTAADGPLKDPRLLDRGTGVDRLRGQPALVDHRHAVHESDGRRFRESPVVVRQRVGLLEPLSICCGRWSRKGCEALHPGSGSSRTASLHPR